MRAVFQPETTGRVGPSSPVVCLRLNKRQDWTVSNPNTIVFIIDDDASVREGLGLLLNSTGFEARSYPSAEAFMATVPEDCPGCLVVDLEMEGMSGLDLQRLLLRRGRLMPLIFLTAHGDIPASVQAMKNGADDFLTKPVDDEVLLEAINRASSRCRELLSIRHSMEAIRARVENLTPREWDVLQGVIRGLMNKEIAADLGIAEQTVKFHRGRMMRKMAVDSVADLVRACEQAGLQP